MFQVSSAELAGRIQALQAVMKEQTIDLAILNVNTDVYYYCGSVQPLYLLIPAAGQALAVARKALQRIAEDSPQLTVEIFANTRDLKRICETHRFGGARRVGMTLENTAAATVSRWQQLFEGAATVDLSWEMRRLRMVKSPAEIAVLAEAGAIMARVPEVIRESFRPGMTELELSAALEYYFRLNGHSGLVRCRREGIEMNYGVCSAGLNSLAGTKFDGICAGVGTAAAVPYGAAAVPIGKGQPVVLDYAFNYQGYHVDQTRIFCWGNPEAAVLKAYDAMVSIEREIVIGLKPGQSWSACYELALTRVQQAGYEAEFMGAGPEKVRFVGHGVGLELDEPPFLAPRMADFLLAENMVLALEPKVALAGVGVVGIEDTVVLRAGRAELITPCSPEMIVI